MSQATSHPCFAEEYATWSPPFGGGLNNCAIPTVGTIERAFQLAAQSFKLPDIKTKLKQEGYSNVDAYLSGGKIRSDLRHTLRRNAAS